MSSINLRSPSGNLFFVFIYIIWIKRISIVFIYVIILHFFLSPS